MTATLRTLRRSAGSPSVEFRESAADGMQTLCVVLAFVGLGYALMHSGGRDRGTTEIALALTAPSLLIGRAWRTVPLIELVLAASVALAATVIPLITPLGVSAASDLNAYTYAAALYLAVRAMSGQEERRRLMMAAILALGVIESLNVVRVWKGENDPSFQIVGTFYWHNQFGAFAAAIALLACGLVMRSRRPEDAIAWLVAPLYLALTWLSVSRAAILALLLTAALLVGTALLRRQWGAVLRAGCAVALAVGVHAMFVAVVSTGAGHGYSPAKDSLSSTSVFRLTAGEEAIKVFAQAPLASYGYGSLGVAGWRHAAKGTTTSPYAHSAEAQALSDGGLILGLPVILALALMAWTALLSSARSAHHPRGPDWVRLGTCLAAVAMLLHASMDFDTQYPVLAALLAAFVALAAPGVNAVPAANRLMLRRAAVLVTVGATVLGAFLVKSYWQTTDRMNSAGQALTADSATSVSVASRALTGHHFTDPRPASFIVAATDSGFVFDDATLRQALRDSEPYARLSTAFSPVWQRVNREVLAASPQSGPTTTAP